MGWIKIKQNPRMLLHTSMSVLVCFDEHGRMSLLETEKLPQVIRDLGRRVEKSELDEIDKTLKEQTKTWWRSYRRHFTRKKQDSAAASNSSGPAGSKQSRQMLKA